jgi:hypothetical protein
MTTDVVAMVKTDQRTLAAADPFAARQLDKFGAGEYVLAALRRPRNLGHHRKFMAMVKLAFDQWNPADVMYDSMPAKKSFDVFRRELVIAAGFYDVVLGLDGQARLEAKSLAFDKMGQDEFADVYDGVFAVLTGIDGILPGMSRPEAERLAEHVYSQGF